MSDCALDRFLYCLLYWNEFPIFKLPLQCVHIQPDTRFPIQNQEFLNSLICQMIHLVKSGVLLFILFMSVFQFAPGSFQIHKFAKKRIQLRLAQCMFGLKFASFHQLHFCKLSLQKQPSSCFHFKLSLKVIIEFVNVFNRKSSKSLVLCSSCACVF